MNCIIVDDDEASRIVLAQLAKQIDYITDVKSCSTAPQAISILRKEQIDLLFLDIEMPGMNGFEMLKALDKKPVLIITSSHKKYALDAFEYGAADYLVKPIKLPRFMKALSKIKDISKDEVSADKNFFFIKKNSIFKKVPIDDILWIEALGDYVTINAKNEKFILHTTVKYIESLLPGKKFVRVHRSYIVQMNNVHKVENKTIFINGTSIPIGASYRENFYERMNTLQ
jgi:two-component system LytT family response regulator